MTDSINHAEELDDEKYFQDPDCFMTVLTLQNFNGWTSFDYKAIHPFQNCTEISYECYWANKTFTEKIKGKTLLDLHSAIEKVVYNSGDHHHVFVEELLVDGTSLKISLGS